MERFKYKIIEKSLKEYKKKERRTNNIKSSGIYTENEIFPGVYILYNKSGKKIKNDIYIGEAAVVEARLQQHMLDPKKEEYNFDYAKIISSSFFNKSATYEIETRLIEYLLADGKFKIINLKKNQNSHNFYQRSRYIEEIFSEVWKELKELEFTKKELSDLQNEYIFKYSPFKSFNINQMIIFNEIEYKIVQENMQSRILVSGEPGTGKSLMIVKLVFDLVNDEKNGINEEDIAVFFPTTNQRKIFQKIFNRLELKKINLITGAKLVVEKPYKVLLVDEAHRLKQVYGRQMRELKHLVIDKEEKNYTDELELAIANSENLVLFYDPFQTVRPADIDTEKFQRKVKNFDEYKLVKQFRMKVSDRYLITIRKILELEDRKIPKVRLGKYKLKIFSSLRDMHKAILEKNDIYGISRLVSGYCYEWKSKKKESRDYYDIVEGDHKLQWNKSTPWVHSENAKNEVGCIHTVQGVDLNYVGVIIGDDIKYNPITKKLEVVLENYYDKNGTPIKGTDKNNVELMEYIKRIYYVLLTRGMRGTYLYFKDKNTENYFIEEFKKYFEDFEVDIS